MKAEGHSHSDAFKAAMRMLAGHVVMVTTRVDGRPWGLTISACCSLSADPPRILVSLGSHTTSLTWARDSGRFGVSILRAVHKPLASFAARPDQPKFIDEHVAGSAPKDSFVEGQAPAELGSPMVGGALHHFDCAVTEAFEVDDHTLLVGLVERVVDGREPHASLSGPLLYFDRRFCQLGETIG